ncbi:MAG: CHAT domain-containing protein [Deltaproteobacteria bacterium]|nr:CHAT domain-containing protein [Deltaproteobacteria bacterium]
MNLKVLLSTGNLIYTLSSSRKSRKFTVEYSTEVIFPVLTELQTAFHHQITGSDKSAVDHIKIICTKLTNNLIPATLRKELSHSSGKLTLEVEEDLFFIPWELLVIENRFFCDQFETGRLLIQNSPSVDGIGTHQTSNQTTIIVSDPGSSLSSSIEEGETILALLKKYGHKNITLLINPTMDKALSAISESFLLHFIGHGFSSEIASGWKFSDATLGIKEIRQLQINGSAPKFIFSNACPPRSSNNLESPVSNAVEFIKAGTLVFIGSHWDLKDKEASDFAGAFYLELASGKSVGASLQSSRSQLSVQGREKSITWATYFLCGKPEFKLSDNNTNDINDFIGHRGDLPAKNSYEDLGEKLKHYDELWTKKNKFWHHRFIQKYAKLSLWLLILATLGILFSNVYLSSRPLRVVFQRQGEILPENRRIDFMGFSNKDILNEVSNEKIEQCFIRHLTTLKSGKIFDKRGIPSKNIPSFFTVSGKIFKDENSIRIFLMVHRTSDRAILYADDFLASTTDEFPCLKLAEWFKSKYHF